MKFKNIAGREIFEENKARNLVKIYAPRDCIVVALYF
jgi:hypothetical protein